MLSADLIDYACSARISDIFELVDVCEVSSNCPYVSDGDSEWVFPGVRVSGYLADTRMSISGDRGRVLFVEEAEIPRISELNRKFQPSIVLFPRNAPRLVVERLRGEGATVLLFCENRKYLSRFLGPGNFGKCRGWKFVGNFLWLSRSEDEDFMETQGETRVIGNFGTSTDALQVAFSEALFEKLRRSEISSLSALIPEETLVSFREIRGEEISDHEILVHGGATLQSFLGGVKKFPVFFVHGNRRIRIYRGGEISDLPHVFAGRVLLSLSPGISDLRGWRFETDFIKYLEINGERTPAAMIDLDEEDEFVKTVCGQIADRTGVTISENAEVGKILESLRRARRFTADGGRSRSLFWASDDGELLLKLVSAVEGECLVQLLCEKFSTDTLLVPVFAAGVTEKKHWCVMRRLRLPHAIGNFDLKGMRRRAPPGSGVRWEEDLWEFLGNFRVPLREYGRFAERLRRDVDWLRARDVVDYSLLLILPRQGENFIAVGIIDYFRPYTWDKRLETVVKSAGASELPTVVEPGTYAERFQRGVLNFFF